MKVGQKNKVSSNKHKIEINSKIKNGKQTNKIP